MRKKKQKNSNLNIAIGFSLLVLGLILLSLLFKGILLVEQSRFDGSNSFSVLFSDKDKNQVVYFSPQNPSISILDINGYNPNSIGKALEIPIDGKVTLDDQVTAKNLSAILFRRILDFRNQTDINPVDFFKLYLFAKTANDNIINEKTISKDTNSQQLSSLTSSLFIDPALSGEKQNIEIINASETYGLGNRLANLVTNIGGNVILVTTQDVTDRSQIQYVKNSYTVKRLSQILGYDTAQVEKKSIPDVIIIIGKDALSKLSY